MDGSAAPMAGERHTTMPPYVSFATFNTFIADLKEHSIPTRIDRSVLTRFSGTVGTQLMTALRFLKLIDAADKPTEHLTALVRAHGTDEWPSVLGTILQGAYGPIFSIDLAKATPSQFNETFIKTFPGKDAVVKKCIAFFLPAAKGAGIPISERILKGKKPRAVNGARPRISRRPASSEAMPPAPPPLPPSSSSSTASLTAATAFQLLAMFDPSTMNAEEQAAVWTLIQYAKKREGAGK